MTTSTSRRDFLKFLGFASLSATASSCSLKSSSPHSTLPRTASSHYGIDPQSLDDLIVAKGLSSSVVIRALDPINAQGDLFGTCNDFIAIAQARGPRDLQLWVNHEEPESLALFGKATISDKSKEQTVAERRACGGSFVWIHQTPDGLWRHDPKDLRNSRISGETPISLEFGSGRHLSQASSFPQNVTGTLANCSGGKTPWGSILTCEENYQDFYGDIAYNDAGETSFIGRPSANGWEKFFDENPKDYGWVVEVDPISRSAKKLIHLGRFAHENALVILANDGRPVVYMGDDLADQYIYKFIADTPGSLRSGKLYVADTHKGKWLSLNFEDQPELQKKYRSLYELRIRTREAAKDLGATPQDRPEGIDQDPFSKAIIISVTGNPSAGRPFGALVKIEEKDPLALDFKFSTLLAGGPETSFSCPDNICFDRRGNLWMCSDISGSKLYRPPFDGFKNNGLFVIPRSGPHAGRAIQMASAPNDAEFTGPCFSPDGRTLFLSVQHPGERTTSETNPTSTWPDRKLPRSAVISLSGDLLNQI